MEISHILMRGQVEATGQFVEGLMAVSLGEDKQPNAGIYLSNPVTGNPWGFKIKHDTLGMWTTMVDVNGKKVFSGHYVVSVLNGMRFTVLFGKHKAWCEADEQWEVTVGFYCEGEDGGQFPIGDLAKWARIPEDIL